MTDNNFPWWALWIFSFLGASLLWLKLRYGSDFYNTVIGFVDEIAENFNSRFIFYFLIFSSIGATIAYLITFPNNPRQALMAGAGFTAFAGGMLGPNKGKGGKSS